MLDLSQLLVVSVERVAMNWAFVPAALPAAATPSPEATVFTVVCEASLSTYVMVKMLTTSVNYLPVARIIGRGAGSLLMNFLFCDEYSCCVGHRLRSEQ